MIGNEAPVCQGTGGPDQSSENYIDSGKGFCHGMLVVFRKLDI